MSARHAGDPATFAERAMIASFDVLRYRTIATENEGSDTERVRIARRKAEEFENEILFCARIMDESLSGGDHA